MRRRNASSTSSRGSRFVEKMIELVEGDLDPLAVGKVEVIAMLFQRQNPAVQQLVDLAPAGGRSRRSPACRSCSSFAAAPRRRRWSRSASPPARPRSIRRRRRSSAGGCGPSACRSSAGRTRRGTPPAAIPRGSSDRTARIISPSTPIARGIQMSWPKARVTRSAMLVLPLPGAPKRNSPRPELIAGPRRSSIFRLSSRSENAASKRSALGCCPVRVCAATLVV